MAEPDAVLRERLDELSREFAERVEDKVSEVEVAYRNLQAASDENLERAIATLIVPVHGLSGSAAAFGYPELGAAARELEECLRTIQDDNPSMASDDLARISDLVRRVREAASP